MVKLVIDAKWSIEATAEWFQVDAKTVRKWRDRYVADGEASETAVGRRGPDSAQDETRPVDDVEHFANG